MTSDPHPDPVGAEPADVPEPLSDADSRLLEALTRPSAHVVTAAEDARSEHEEPTGLLSAAARRGPVTPVFQEPSG